MEDLPQFNLVGEDEPLICSDCGNDVSFLTKISECEDEDENGSFCRECFDRRHPEHTAAIDLFNDMLNWLIEERSNYMTTDEWHELYGENQDETES